jgi:hypothetical protein
MEVLELYYWQPMDLDLIGGENSQGSTSSFEADLPSSYWDPEIQPAHYSLVDFAIAKGHSVFFYDRLGVSRSSVFVQLARYP